jgi:hypothetical protein
MRKSTILTLALLAAVLIPAALQVYAAASTIDGVVSDTKCGRKHLPGKTDAKCIQECLKSKASYALVVGANIYTLAGKPETFAPFACKHVKVEGILKELMLTVISIHEMQQDMPADMPM